MRGVCRDDIVAHSTNGFPVRTGEEFLAFLRAAAASGAGRPEALGAFLAAHPHAKRFVDTPTPIPTSFVREASFAVTAFTFTNADGVSRQGRFRIRPDAGTAYLTLTARGDDQVPDLRRIIFDPVSRVDGLESSDDPLTSPEDQEWTGHLSDDILGHKCMIAAQIAAPAKYD